MTIHPDADDFVVADGLTFRIGGSTVLDHVDLRVRRGELLGIAGPNGAGKSSLLRCLAGLWPATEGTVTIDGLDRERDDLAIRRFTAYLPAEPEAVAFAPLTQLRLLAEAYSVPEHAFQARKDALLQLFDLEACKDTSVTHLSKGEAKKASVAGALVTGARLYLLDEPFTGGIDPRGYHALERVLERLARSSDVTVLVASQVLEILEALCDRVAIIDHGRLRGIGTLEELRATFGCEGGATLEQVFAAATARDAGATIDRLLDALDIPA